VPEPSADMEPARFQSSSDALSGVLVDVEVGRSPATPLREGLPASYRMRADSHYVEQIDSKPVVTPVQLVPIDMIAVRPSRDVGPLGPLVDSIRRHGVLQPLLVQRHGGGYRLLSGGKRLAAAIEAGLREVPCLLHHVGDEEARLLAEAAAVTAPTASPEISRTASGKDATDAIRELRQSFLTIASCVDLLRDETATLSRKVAIDLAQAEVWRSCCPADAARVLNGDLKARRRTVRACTVIEEAVQRSEAERRLRRINFNLVADVAETVALSADEHLLALAVSGALAATVATLDGVPDAGVTLAVSLDPLTNWLRFVVFQDTVAVANWSQAFDQTWVDRPGGASAIIWARAAQRIAEWHGGSATARALEHGVSMTIVIPTPTLAA